MQDLWGREIEPVPSRQRSINSLPPAAPQSPRPLAALECAYYGHSWERIGLCGEKCCTVCGIVGYCPGCTPLPPQGAQPFFCTQHTPSASTAAAGKQEGGQV